MTIRQVLKPVKHLGRNMLSDRSAPGILTSLQVVQFFLSSLKFCNLQTYLFTGVKWMFTIVNSFCENFVAYSEVN